MDVANIKGEVVAKLVNAGVITEDEARGVLDGDPVIGDLDDVDMQSMKADEREMQQAMEVEKIREMQRARQAVNGAA